MALTKDKLNTSEDEMGISKQESRGILPAASPCGLGQGRYFMAESLSFLLLAILALAPPVIAREGNRGPSAPNSPQIYQALPGKSEKCLSLHIRLNKEVYWSGEPITVTLALKNMGDTPLLINHRLFLWHEIRLNIKGKKGQTLRWLPPAPPAPLTSNDFSPLAPQQQLTWEMNIVDQMLYDKLVPGIYLITATYQNTSGKELGIHAWTGQLESNPVSFKVMGQRNDDLSH